MDWLPLTLICAFSLASADAATKNWLQGYGSRELALIRFSFTGLLMGVMVVTHFLVLQQVEVAYMIAVKRTSLLFGILYGAWLFKERGLGVHLFGGCVMMAGVVLIAI